MQTTLQPPGQPASTPTPTLTPALATPERTLDVGAAALWASAFVIAAMILTQAARLGPGSAAYAGEVSDVGQLRLLTAQSGNNEEYIALINSTDETLSIYGIENGRSLELYQVQPLRELFLGLGRGAQPRR